MLNSRVEKLSRDAWASSVGGAKAGSPAITSAPSACFESFSPAIASLTTRSRSTGSSTYTGSGPRIAAIRLPSSPRSASARIETGTSPRGSGADQPGDGRAHLAPLGAAPARAQPRAHAASHDGQHHVVHGPAEGIL